MSQLKAIIQISSALAGALVVVLCFSGCIQGPAQADQGPDTHHEGEAAPPSIGTHQPTGNESTPVSSEGAVMRMRLILDDCQRLGTLRYAISDVVGASPPEGWGPGPTPATEVFIELYDCARLSLGPFERGPIRFLMEVHDNREPPLACRDGDYTSSEVITQVAADDAEVVAYLVTRLGLPASLATIEPHSEPLQGADQLTWTFSLEGYPRSYLTGYQSQESDTTGTYDYRRFWTNQHGGISFMDFEETWRRAGSEAGVIHGEVREPFLHVPGVESYLGTGYSVPESSVDAPIKEFGDMSCTQPLP